MTLSEAPLPADSSSAPVDPLAGGCPVPLRQREQILLGHGSGGLLSAELIESIFLPALDNPQLRALEDQAQLPFDGESRLAFTTDSYVVSPMFFPGGSIGELAVNGTINDLAMGGAEPLGLSLAFILEEGLPLARLRQVVDSVSRAARAAGVPVVTGDTKVVERGSADGLFINTSGVGRIPKNVQLGARHVRPGDVILVSGTLGDHGIAVLGERYGLGLSSIKSDTAALHGLARRLLFHCPTVHALRDPTRGGLVSSLCEIAARCRLGIEIDESAIPVSEGVRGACELLGLDPLFVANEGKLIAFVPEAWRARALDVLGSHPLGQRAACIGRVVEPHRGQVIARSPFGGERLLERPLDELLPRIC